MKRLMMLATIGVVILGWTMMGQAETGDKPASQTKTGVVQKVDLAAKQIVVMVSRELTFTITDATKIVQGDADKKLADIKVNAKVTVDYTRTGDVRIAQKIVILGGQIDYRLRQTERPKRI